MCVCVSIVYIGTSNGTAIYFASISGAFIACEFKICPPARRTKNGRARALQIIIYSIPRSRYAQLLESEWPGRSAPQKLLKLFREPAVQYDDALVRVLSTIVLCCTIILSRYDVVVWGGGFFFVFNKRFMWTKKVSVFYAVGKKKIMK